MSEIVSQLVNASVESLESRRLLAAQGPSETATSITAAYVAGTAWSAAFRQHLLDAGQGDPARGYLVSDAGEHGAPLPWTNLNAFSFDLSAALPADVAADTTRVNVFGASGIIYPLASFSADASRQRLTFQTQQTIAAERLRIEFDLDATPGADREIRLNILPGDVNRSSGAVDAADLVLTRNRVGQVAGGSNYSAAIDVDGSGSVNALDLVTVRNRVGVTLPVAVTPTKVFGQRRIALEILR